MSTTAPDYTKDFECRCRLADIMREKNIDSYVEVQRLTGVFVTVVARLAKGETKGIDFHTILRLCMGLGVTPSQLFVIDEKSASSPDTQ